MKPHSHLSHPNSLFYSYDLGADNAPIEWLDARSHAPNSWPKTRDVLRSPTGIFRRCQ
jgi:hypothetical protein